MGALITKRVVRGLQGDEKDDQEPRNRNRPPQVRRGSRLSPRRRRQGQRQRRGARQVLQAERARRHSPSAPPRDRGRESNTIYLSPSPAAAPTARPAPSAMASPRPLPKWTLPATSRFEQTAFSRATREWSSARSTASAEPAGASSSANASFYRVVKQFSARDDHAQETAKPRRENGEAMRIETVKQGASGTAIVVAGGSSFIFRPLKSRSSVSARRPCFREPSSVKTQLFSS